MRDQTLVCWAASGVPAILLYALGPTKRAALLAATLAAVAALGIVVAFGRESLLAAVAVLAFGAFYAAAARLSVEIAAWRTGQSPNEFLGIGMGLMKAPREVYIASAIWAITAGPAMALSVVVFYRVLS